MPFCTRCGHEASPADVFCSRCGARQTPGGPGDLPIAPDPLAGLTPHTASILCYIPTVGWIAAIIVLATRKFKNDHIVRFHAFQGLYLFSAWLIVSWVVRPMAMTLPEHFVRIDHILEAAILAISIFMMIKASHDQPYVLPIIGELAQRSASER